MYSSSIINILKSWQQTALDAVVSCHHFIHQLEPPPFLGENFTYTTLIRHVGMGFNFEFSLSCIDVICILYAFVIFYDTHGQKSGVVNCIVILSPRRLAQVDVKLLIGFYDTHEQKTKIILLIYKERNAHTSMLYLVIEITQIYVDRLIYNKQVQLVKFTRIIAIIT